MIEVEYTKGGVVVTEAIIQGSGLCGASLAAERAAGITSAGHIVSVPHGIAVISWVVSLILM